MNIPKVMDDTEPIRIKIVATCKRLQCYNPSVNGNNWCRECMERELARNLRESSRFPKKVRAY